MRQTMTQQHQSSTKSTLQFVSPEQMVDELQQRIDFLQTLQEGIMFAYYGREIDLDVEVAPEQPVPRKTAARKRRKVARNTVKTNILVTDVLNSAAEPLTLQQVLTEMQTRGWKSTSAKPIGVLSVALAKMRRLGDVTSADGKWMLATAIQAAHQSTSATDQSAEAAA